MSARLLPSDLFRARLREARRLRDWTQADLAVILAKEGTDIGEPGINRLERGHRGVSLDEAVAIAAVLGFPLSLMISDAEWELSGT